MSRVDLIRQNAGALPDARKSEGLSSVDHFLARQSRDAEERDSSRFSLEQMSHNFAQGDAVYDQD
jgi:hypothetical protein